MLKDLAWNTFKYSGNIDTFLEFAKLQKIEETVVTKNASKVEKDNVLSKITKDDTFSKTEEDNILLKIEKDDAFSEIERNNTLRNIKTKL